MLFVNAAVLDKSSQLHNYTEIDTEWDRR